jgi:hypothetical protein
MSRMTRTVVSVVLALGLALGGLVANAHAVLAKAGPATTMSTEMDCACPAQASDCEPQQSKRCDSGSGCMLPCASSPIFLAIEMQSLRGPVGGELGTHPRHEALASVTSGPLFRPPRI